MRRLIVLGLLAVAAVGCVPSKNRLYEKGDVAFEEALVGEYQEKGPDIRPPTVVEKGPDGNYLYGSKEAAERNPLQLLTLGDHYFMDTGSWFFKIDAVGQEVHVWIMSPDWIKGLVDKDPKAVAHEIRKQKVVENGEEKEKDEVVLTGSTKDVRAFVQKHLDTAAAWSGPIRYQAQHKLPVVDKGLFGKKQRATDAWWEFRQALRSLGANATLTDLSDASETLGRLTEAGLDDEAAAVAKQAARGVEQIIEKGRKGQDTAGQVTALIKETAGPAKKAAAQLSERYGVKFAALD